MNKTSDNFFLQFLKEVFGVFKDEDAEIENEKLVELGENQDEKDAIAIICDDIDAYHEEMDVMQENDIDEDRLGEFTEFRIQEFASDNEPDLSEAEKTELASDIEKVMEESILTVSQDFANDLAGEEVDVDDIIKTED